MTFDTLLFRCAICAHDVRDHPNRRGPDKPVAPLCRYCERHWTEHTGKPMAGAFMDRRKVLHIIALANALHNTAAIMKWNADHGRA